MPPPLSPIHCSLLACRVFAKYPRAPVRERYEKRRTIMRETAKTDRQRVAAIAFDAAPVFLALPSCFRRRSDGLPRRQNVYFV
jgi:hypothetical protein